MSTTLDEALLLSKDTVIQIIEEAGISGSGAQDVTQLQKEGLTGLSIGHRVRVTDAGNREEVYIGGTISEQSSWRVVTSSPYTNKANHPTSTLAQRDAALAHVGGEFTISGTTVNPVDSSGTHYDSMDKASFNAVSGASYEINARLAAPPAPPYGLARWIDMLNFRSRGVCYGIMSYVTNVNNIALNGSTRLWTSSYGTTSGDYRGTSSNGSSLDRASGVFTADQDGLVQFVVGSALANAAPADSVWEVHVRRVG